VAYVADHPPTYPSGVEALKPMSVQTLRRDPPPEAAMFASFGTCDHCGRWVGWGVHRKTGAEMPIDLPANPEGPLVLHSDGVTMMIAGAQRNEPRSRTARRFQKHECGRPGMPVRGGRPRYADPSREQRRQEAIRRDARWD
jgi:hypothetical protein